MEQLLFLSQKLAFEMDQETTSGMDELTDRLFTSARLVPVLLMGCALIYWAYREKKKVENMEKVEAVCVNRILYATHRSLTSRRKSKTYISVFEYTYCGTTYTETDAFNTGTNIGLPKVGEPCIVRLDPEHPEKPYYLNHKSNLFLVFIGVAIIALSLYGIIMYNIQF